MLVINSSYARGSFVRNPSARTFVDTQGRFVIELPTEGLAIRGSFSLKVIFDIFKIPMMSSEISEVIVKKLIHCRVLVPESIADIMARGTTSEARSALSSAKIDLCDLCTEYAIIGSAVDFAQVGRYSTYRGPDCIRRYIGPSENLSDIGDVAWLPSEGLISYGKRLGYIFSLVHDRKSIPVILGGDHTLTYFSVLELCAANVRVGVVQFDAHNDLGIPRDILDLNYLTHANVAGYLRRLPIKFLLQAGLRKSQIGFTSSPGDCPLYQVGDAEITKFDSIITETLQTHPVDALYVSVDLDCINPKEAPDVSTPLDGGLSYSDLKQCIQKTISIAPIIGADFVEVSPNSEYGQAASFAAELIQIIIKGRV